MKLEDKLPPNRLGPDAYKALYEFGPNGVLFTAPDGRILAANPAACEILGRSEAEICSLGRQGIADLDDERWDVILSERDRTGRAHGIARVRRGDGVVIELEMSSSIFVDADGEKRTCTVIRDDTDRVKMERELVEMSARLRELTVTDDLTGLLNRRGFDAIGSQMLDVADRQRSMVFLLFADVDHMKELNDDRGHSAGDAALRAVARALRSVLRRADVAARIGGDEFVALALGASDFDRLGVERRIREYLCRRPAVAVVGQVVHVSMGWAARSPDEARPVDKLLADADRDMYRAKAAKRAERDRLASSQ